ncbi:MAG: hypothetical protein HUJ56_11670 [Erysipelotrichaceae bacterium]|nr:hypothetical protein [Erysipelotrichaceae bacterium]
MSLPYDLRELMYKGQPIWKRVIECIIYLGEKVDSIEGGTTGGSDLTDKIEELEDRIEALENESP